MELVLGDGGMDQLLSYNATFTMGDFYVSILIFRHLFYEKFMHSSTILVHERKYEERHQKLFHVLNFLHGQKIACVTDGKRDIYNFILNKFIIAVYLRGSICYLSPAGLI